MFLWLIKLHITLPKLDNNPSWGKLLNFWLGWFRQLCLVWNINWNYCPSLGPTYFLQTEVFFTIICCCMYIFRLKQCYKITLYAWVTLIFVLYTVAKRHNFVLLKNLVSYNNITWKYFPPLGEYCCSTPAGFALYKALKRSRMQLFHSVRVCGVWNLKATTLS